MLEQNHNLGFSVEEEVKSYIDFSKLPEELFGKIVTFLDKDSVYKSAVVSKVWHDRIYRDPFLLEATLKTRWICTKDFESDMPNGVSSFIILQGNMIVLASINYEDIRMYNFLTGAFIRSFTSSHNFHKVAELLALTNGNFISRHISGEIILWNIDSKECLARVSTPYVLQDYYAIHLESALKGLLVLTNSRRNRLTGGPHVVRSTVNLFECKSENVSEEKAMITIKPTQKISSFRNINCIATLDVEPDVLICGCKDGYIELWNISSRKKLHEILPINSQISVDIVNQLRARGHVVSNSISRITVLNDKIVCTSSSLLMLLRYNGNKKILEHFRTLSISNVSFAENYLYLNTLYGLNTLSNSMYFISTRCTGNEFSSYLMRFDLNVGNFVNSQFIMRSKEVDSFRNGYLILPSGYLLFVTTRGRIMCNRNINMVNINLQDVFKAIPNHINSMIGRQIRTINLRNSTSSDSDIEKLMDFLKKGKGSKLLLESMDLSSNPYLSFVSVLNFINFITSYSNNFPSLREIDFSGGNFSDKALRKMVISFEDNRECTIYFSRKNDLLNEEVVASESKETKEEKVRVLDRYGMFAGSRQQEIQGFGDSKHVASARY